MIKMGHVAIALLTAFASAAYAQTPPAPATQGNASIDKNLLKNPDNKGLQNADRRVEANAAKAAAKRQRREAHKREHREERQERLEREEREDRMERPARPGRPGR